MIPCPSCSRHVRAVERRCPHCGEAVGSRATRASLVLAFALVACGPDPAPQPTYGIGVTVDETGDTGEGR